MTMLQVTQGSEQLRRDGKKIIRYFVVISKSSLESKPRRSPELNTYSISGLNSHSSPEINWQNLCVYLMTFVTDVHY
jgi:hypothetical protein